MHPPLDALLDVPEQAYLTPDELDVLSQFVRSLPERIDLYRHLRTNEAHLFQTLVDRLQQAGPPASVEQLKRCLQNGILTMRWAAMAMLTDDANLVTHRLHSWLPDMMAAYHTRSLDHALHQLLREALADRFTPQEMALLLPALDAVQALLGPPEAAAMSSGHPWLVEFKAGCYRKND
jgi:hypothetical protein